MSTADRCSVAWCSLPADDDHLTHKSQVRVVQGDVSAGMDAPEHEGAFLAVGIESTTAHPRLGISIIGREASPTVRLSAEATAVVKELLS